MNKTIIAEASIPEDLYLEFLQFSGWDEETFRSQFAVHARTFFERFIQHRADDKVRADRQAEIDSLNSLAESALTVTVE